MKKILVFALLAIIAGLFFGCSKETVTGPSSLAGVIVFRDDSPGYNTNPTGAPGNRFLQMATFFVIGDGTEAIYKITFEDAPGIPMGVNFQNLALWNNVGPLGTTKGDLNMSPGKYTFTLDSSMNLAAGAVYSFQLFVDIKNSAEVNKSVPILRFYSITTIDKTGKIHEYLNPFSFSPIYISSYVSGKG